MMESKKREKKEDISGYHDEDENKKERKDFLNPCVDI